MYCSAQTADHGIDIHIPMRDDTLGVNINVYIISHRMMCIDNNSAQTSQMLINEETNKVLPSFMFRVLCKVGNHQRNHFVQTAYRVTSVFFVFFYISHYSATEINPFHVCSVAENTTEINHTDKLIFFIRGSIIVDTNIFY